MGVEEVGVAREVKGSMYAVVLATGGGGVGREIGAGRLGTAADVVVVVVLCLERCHGHLEGEVRAGVSFFLGESFLGVSFFSESFFGELFLGVSVFEAPATVPAAVSLLLYPNIESPSTLLWRVKFGIDLVGLAGEGVMVRLYKSLLLSIWTGVGGITTLGLRRALIVVGVGESDERDAPASESGR